MKELYERVLAHLPTLQLHKSYNAVLHEEFASASQTLDDVLAAFTKLEEVHDAVSKLQQGHDCGRSDSLMASANNTMDLQRQLQHEVEKLAAGMKVAQLERKRKRVDEKAATMPGALNPARKSGADEKTRPRTSCNSAVKRMKAVEVIADSDADSESSEEEEETKFSAQDLLSKEGDDYLAMKRNVTVATGFESSSSSGSESDGSEEDDSDEDAGDVEGSEAAWKALMAKSDDPSSEMEPAPKTAKNAVKQTKTGTSTATRQSTKTVWFMKIIVEAVSPLDRSFIIPELLTGLKESVEWDVKGSQWTAVRSCLNVLVGWWAHGSPCEVQYAGLYREYAAVVQSYCARLRRSRQKRGIKRSVSQSNTDFRQVVPAKEKEKAAAAIKYAKMKGAFSLLMGGPDTLPYEKQTKRLLHVLLAFKKETGRDVDDAFSTRMIKAIGRLIRWLSYDLDNHRHLPLYRMIVNTMRAFSERMPDQSTRERIFGLLEDISESISDPSNAKNHKQLIKLGKDATQLLGELKKWQGRSISPEEALKLREAVKALMEDMTIGWNPCQDITMRKCVKELKSILIQAQAQASGDAKSRRGFEVCLSVVLRWKVEDPPAVHVVRAPTE